MSDAGLSLEQPGEIVGVGEANAETPPQTPAPQAPAPTPDDADPEGTITGEGGIKFVPLGAVKAERERRQTAEKALKAREGEVSTLKQKADAYDSAARYLQEATPIIEAVKKRPDLVKLANEPAPDTTAASGPLSADAAERYARRFDLYTADGKPDIARAQEIARDHEAQMRRVAQETVAPLQQTEATRQSGANFQYYASTKDAQGNALVDVNVLREVWAGVPADMSARPEVAQVLYLTALGKQTVDGKTPRPSALAPVVPTESVGGGKPQPTDLTDTDLKFMRAGGMSRETFTKTREQFKPGANNFLEE